jgi:hypothetical protein
VGYRLRLAQKLSPDSSGSIATSSAASVVLFWGGGNHPRTRGLPGGVRSPAKPVSTGRIPCLQGKEQGNFSTLSLFGEKRSLKSLCFHDVMAKFPKILSRELICWTREWYSPCAGKHRRRGGVGPIPKTRRCEDLAASGLSGCPQFAAELRIHRSLQVGGIADQKSPGLVMPTFKDHFVGRARSFRVLEHLKPWGELFVEYQKNAWRHSFNGERGLGSLTISLGTRQANEAKREARVVEAIRFLARGDRQKRAILSRAKLVLAASKETSIVDKLFRKAGPSRGRVPKIVADRDRWEAFRNRAEPGACIRLKEEFVRRRCSAYLRPSRTAVYRPADSSQPRRTFHQKPMVPTLRPEGSLHFWRV